MAANTPTPDGQTVGIPLEDWSQAKPFLDVLDLETEPAHDSNGNPDSGIDPSPTNVKGKISRVRLGELKPRAATCTLALDVVAAEEDVDPRPAHKRDKIRNISRGLNRFRIKRESKGVHGRSFQGAFSQFAETGNDGRVTRRHYI
ncbi:MAG: hypothetical protein Q9169_005752 [Polycauliona sp. 2 TL-2023]